MNKKVIKKIKNIILLGLGISFIPLIIDINMFVYFPCIIVSSLSCSILLSIKVILKDKVLNKNNNSNNNDFCDIKVKEKTTKNLDKSFTYSVNQNRLKTKDMVLKKIKKR